MDFNLDKLFNFPNATVESCSIIDNISYFQIRWLNEKIQCPICGETTTKLHQERQSLIRDLSVFGRAVYLKIPRNCPDIVWFSVHNHRRASPSSPYSHRLF